VQQEVGFFDSTKTGELISRIGSDTEALKDTATVNISMGLRWVSTVVGGIVYLFILSWKLALVMLGVVPAIAIATVIYGNYIRKLTKEQQAALAEAAEIADETIASIRTVRSFTGEERMNETYGAKIATTRELGIRNAWAGGIFVGLTSAIASCAFIGLVYYGGTLVISGEITEGILTSFLLYAIQIGAALGGLASLFGSIMGAMGATDRVFRLLDREPDIPVRDPKGARPTSVSGLIEIEDVQFAYPSRPDVPVLRGLSLTIRPGEVHALVGPSGGGKSTVVNLIERFYDPQEGCVKLDGRDVRSLDPWWLREQVGLVRQEPTLFGYSCKENIAFSHPEAPMSLIEDAARQASAHEFISAFPEGYDTVVGERGVRLSGGQKQRVAIAQAVLKDPTILLLDEATSALDAESEHLVQEALERLMKGRTVLIIAHRLSTVKSANVVHVVNHGKVVASGTHEELLRSSPLYANLVKRQLAAGEVDRSSGSDDVEGEEEVAAAL
jgi:ABC-type multidrug transport system fused ATPase/permease subunit